MECQSASVVPISSAEGVYSVREKLWVVGPRYELHEHVGAGANGDVCRATDLETREQVALKRIPDIFLSLPLAKRVLREVCIMRCLRHPHVISLSNVFTSGNLEKKGAVDLYIATEFAHGGDMYHVRNPVQQDQVQLLIWQLLSGMRYLHSCHILHWDMKSENVLLSAMLDVKICDFGLSRPIIEPCTNMEPRRVPTTGRTRSSQNTKTLMTASYTAPEVIMSQGQYKSTVDIWAVGCIFWELLDRQLCSSRTVPPLRRLFTGLNNLVEGEVYAEDGHSKLSELQLDMIFDVIGTPCWKDIQNVRNKEWRSYLEQVPGRAGNLRPNLKGVVDKEALDLLSRMLAFDPARRCTATEALKHAYFKSLTHPQNLPPGSFEDAASGRPSDSYRLINYPAIALGTVERKFKYSMSQSDGGRQALKRLLQNEVEELQREEQQEQLKIRKAVMEYREAQAALSWSVERMAKDPALQVPPAPALDAMSGVVNSQMQPVAERFSAETTPPRKFRAQARARGAPLRHRSKEKCLRG